MLLKPNENELENDNKTNSCSEKTGRGNDCHYRIDSAAYRWRIPTMKCLYKNCVKDAHCRGLCLKHYNKAIRLIKLGRVTDDGLVNRGRILKAKRSGNGIQKDTFFEA
jgi:hypothetical protein